MTTTRSSETQVKHGLKYGQSYLKNRDVIWHKKRNNEIKERMTKNHGTFIKNM